MGAANVVIAAYKARARDRELYFTVGMTRGEIALTTLAELLAVLIACLVVIPVLALLGTLYMDTAANSFGFDILI